MPQSARSEIQPSLVEAEAPELQALLVPENIPTKPADPKALPGYIEMLKKQMFESAAKREYERAAQLRDLIKTLQLELLSAE